MKLNRKTSKLFHSEKKKFDTFQLDADYDKTGFQFPSPNHDTQSQIQDVNFADGSHGSAIANRFKFKGTPTSPIKFDSPNKSSNDIDGPLFNPHSSSSSFEYGLPNSVEDQTPTLQKHLSNYYSYLDKLKPPPASLEQFFGNITFKKPVPEVLSISKITTASFISYFSELKESIINEISSKENEISRLEQHFDTTPPYILDNFNRFPESSKQNIINYFQLYTELYRLLSTLSINKQILALENSYSRNDIKSVSQKLFNSKQSIVSIKDIRLDNYLRYIELQEQLEKSKPSDQQIDSRSKFLNLKSHLSYTVMQIKNGQGTIKLADYLINRKPFIPNNMYEAHCQISCSYRVKELEYEINEISNFFPFVIMNGTNLSITVLQKEKELRFDVIFPIKSSYPWCKIEARTNVLIGDSKAINSTILQICSNVSFCRKPILEICSKIAETFLNSQSL